MKTISQWVRDARTFAGLTQTQLGEALGTTKGNVSAWEKERHHPAYEHIKKIRDITRYPEPPPGMGYRLDSSEDAPIGSRLVPILTARQVAVYDGEKPDEKTTFLFTERELSARAFAMRLGDPSMRAPAGQAGDSFNEGDMVLVDCGLSPRPGDYVVAAIGPWAMMKKYRIVGFGDDGKEIFELAPINPDFPVLRSAEQDIHIVGVAVEHRKSLR